MSDLGHEQTDKDLKKLESIISKEYGVAAKELENKMLKHYADFDRKDADMKKKLADGLITKTQYENWRIGQVATGKRWEELRDSMTNTLVNADKAAAALIQGNNIKAYGDNMNYGTYEVEHGSKINTGFSLYDVDTVKNLLKEDPKIIPMPKVDIPKDELWNRQKLTSAVMQGILQGESMGGIANRLSSVANMDENAAIRNARTYTTAAENKGRLDSYERAEKLGIKTNKKWIATLDDRTRMEHRHLDNMVVAYNEDFETDGYKISFPGDPSAEPEMIYNCRCTLVVDIPGVDYNDKRYDEKLGDMTYEEWKHAKDKEPAETEEEREKRELDAIHQFQQVSYEGISADEKDSLKDFINDNEDVTDQVSRGMIVDQSQIDKWIKDGEISMSDMSSWSTDGTTAAEFANVNRKVDAEDGKRSVIIVSENGLPDSALLPRTNAYSESEVLTLTDKYTILSSEVQDSIGDNKSPTVTIIHVEPKDENSAAEPAAEEKHLEVGMEINLPYTGKFEIVEINDDIAIIEQNGERSSALVSYIEENNPDLISLVTEEPNFPEPEEKVPVVVEEINVETNEREEVETEISIPDIGETKVFGTSKEADEYFRGYTYKSELGSINKNRGYGVMTEDDKPATKWENKLTSNQTQAIVDYSGMQYEPINNFLRGIWDKDYSNDMYGGRLGNVEKAVKNMDSALKKFDLKEPITVYRTCERDFLDKLNVGSIFHDEGYGSTSVLPIPVASGDVHLEVAVPAGKGMGAYIEGLSWKEGEEFEFLLARGADYYIESIEEREDGIYVKAAIAGFTRED